LKAFSLETSKPIVSKVGFMIQLMVIIATRTLLRATLSLSMLRGLAVSVLSTRRASSETTNDALWTM